VEWYLLLVEHVEMTVTFSNEDANEMCYIAIVTIANVNIANIVQRCRGVVDGEGLNAKVCVTDKLCVCVTWNGQIDSIYNNVRGSINWYKKRVWMYVFDVLKLLSGDDAAHNSHKEYPTFVRQLVSELIIRKRFASI
jgi:hypothetical protein